MFARSNTWIVITAFRVDLIKINVALNLKCVSSMENAASRRQLVNSEHLQLRDLCVDVDCVHVARL